MSPIRRVFCPFPENGIQKQQLLQMKLSGSHAGNSPEEKETISPRVVPVVWVVVRLITPSMVTMFSSNVNWEILSSPIPTH